MTAMVDAAMAVAIMSSIGRDHWHATIEIKINFFRAAPLGEFVADSQVLWKGRNVVHVEATLFNEGGEPVAKGLSSCIVKRRSHHTPDRSV